MKTTVSGNKLLKKSVIGSFIVGMAFSSVSAFAADSAVIPASVIVQEDEVLAVSLTSLGSNSTLEFKPSRGEWDDESFEIENTGNVEFHPSITYQSASANKFDGPSVDIADSAKLLLKNGDNTIHDFTTNDAYLPNGTTKLIKNDTMVVTLEVGAGENITDDYINSTFNFDVKVTAVQ